MLHLAKRLKNVMTPRVHTFTLHSHPYQWHEHAQGAGASGLDFAGGKCFSRNNNKISVE